MQTFDVNTAARLRGLMNATIGRPDPQRVETLYRVVLELLTALEGNARALQVTDRGNVMIKGADSLTLNCGSATLDMDKAGNVTLKSRRFDAKTSGDTTIKGANIRQN